MIRILFVHSVTLMGDLMVAVVKNVPNIEVIGSVRDKAEALARLKKEKCDVVLVDVGLSADEALCLTQTIKETYPQIKVLVTGLTESAAVIIPYLEQGAAGYILQDESVEDLVNKIYAAQREEFLVSPGMTTALIARITELKQMATELNGYKSQDLDPMDELTAREREVLKLIEQGSTNMEVARTLMIELGTVKNHVHNIFAKLGVGSRRHAALFARMRTDEVVESR